MKRFLLGLASCVLTSLSACASISTPTKVHHINDLASPDSTTGSFKGIEAMARTVPGTDIKRVNIVYIHGIGWTEHEDTPELGNSFLSGIASAYDGVDKDSFVVNRCRLSRHDETEGELDHTFIESINDTVYATGLKGSAVKLKKLACMDKQVLRTDSNLEFVVYRVFWDDSFWQALQSVHVGYDDASGANNDIAPLRRKYNRSFKDDIVNYGFSDAVMYLGPAGEKIREAVHGAICAAALDAAGYNFKQQTHKVTKAAACTGVNNRRKFKSEPFVFVTESLGSKILFDVMNETMADRRNNVIDQVINGSEIYMLANQIPLLSLGDLRPLQAGKSINRSAHRPNDRPRIIALSELNDFLSYELVPFYESLYTGTFDLRRDKKLHPKYGLRNTVVREKMIDDIGFDIVDMRVEFADPIIPVLKGFVDPKQAHSDHAKQPLLMQYILCGAKNGQLHTDGCNASKDKDSKK